MREELLKNENISKFLKEKKKKSNIIENEKKSEINYNYLNKKRKSTFIHNQEKNYSINLENYIELSHKTEKIKKYTKNINSIILQKNEIIEKEKLKNLNLNKKLKELESASKNNLKKIKIELKNEKLKN